MDTMDTNNQKLSKVQPKERNIMGQLLGEQLNVTKIEKELENLHDQVNQQINILSVEELQLKAHFCDIPNKTDQENASNEIHQKNSSNKIHQKNSSNEIHQKNPSNPTLPNNADIPEEVNKQFLDLDTFVKCFEEEFDSDSN